MPGPALPPKLPAQPVRLRFGPGARVVCNTGPDPQKKGSREIRWVAGTVLASYELPYKVLLDTGARVNAQTGTGRTALHEAATRGHASMAKALLDAGADVVSASDREPRRRERRGSERSRDRARARPRAR